MQKDAIDAAIDQLGAALEASLGEQLSAVLVYGSLVRGGYDPETSDHNVCLVLADDSAKTLRKIAEVMRAKRPSKRTTLLLMTREELERARDVFPLKLQDISRHHRLVCGTDADLRDTSFASRHLARDCEQQLRGLAIRGRRLFLRGTSNLDLLIHNLILAYQGLIPPLAGLVELMGEPYPLKEEDTLRLACSRLGVPLEPLLELRRLKREPSHVPAESQVNTILDGMLKLLRSAAERADALHDTHVLADNQEHAESGRLSAIASAEAPVPEPSAAAAEASPAAAQASGEGA